MQDQIDPQQFRIPHTLTEDISQDSHETTLPLSSSQTAEQVDTNNAGKIEVHLSTEVTKSVQLLVGEMQSLRQDFDTKVKYDESKERQIDSLHRELQTYREGLHFKILRPLFIDLIALHDDLGKLIESMSDEGANGASTQSAKNLASFQETIEEILRRNGVETFFVEGNTFNSNRQRVLQTKETGDPSLDKQVARRVRKGFEYEGRVLRPELVVTYRAVANK